MLTDVFFIRYEETPLFRSFLRREKRALHQCFTVLEEFHPYWGEEGDTRKASSKFWEEVHKRLANELGVRWLSDAWYETYVGLGEYRRKEHKQRAYIEICRSWYNKQELQTADIDEFLKERLSLIEVGLRIKYNRADSCRRYLESASNSASLLAKSYQNTINEYETAASEINERFRSARFPLNYHNGFSQIEADLLVSNEIEQPFWSLVSEPIWQNVDLDMKEAVDQRDNGGKDPALFAAKALESTIKIISDKLGLTHGGEKGAHNYIDNLSKKSVVFLVDWEKELIKAYFTKVRNQLGHGPGSEPMPQLSPDQTSWAIENAMSLIKLLVLKFETHLAGAS
ncbi:AbiJ-NTD4 domain-containing protein [Ruegeria arenilitoris]|uniref:AbiJ-NTD4 domain-containing protein n=1 Tax=Ruegeria arenilitoris TaxID=1173585 RepID=UPI001481462F